MELNLPYHPALLPYCSENQWKQIYTLDKVMLLRDWGIRDMRVLIECILWPTDNVKILPLKGFHQDMIRLFMACMRGEIQHKEVLYLIPRFHLKTQLITTAGTVWVLLNDPEECVLVTSQGLDLSERIVGEAIRPIYTENLLFRACYPEWCPTDNLARNWGTQSKLKMCNRVSTNKTPSVMAGSFSAPKTGDHFGVIINDDPHNQLNITTIDQIQKVKEGLKAQLPLGDGKRTKRFYAATRWHFSDVNDEIMQNRAPNFYKKFIDKTLLYNQPLANIEKEDRCAVFFLSVWTDENKTEVIWPEKEPVENLEFYRSDMGSYFFSCQMENDPVPPEDRTFNPDDFCYYTVAKEISANGVPEKYYMCGEEKIGEGENRVPILQYRKIPVSETTNFMTVDPAFGIKPHNDYCGIVVCAHWTEPKTRLRWLIVLDVCRQKMTTAQSKRKIEELYIKWNCKKVGIESHAIQTVYLEGLERDPRWAGQLNIRVVRITRGTGESKGMRVTRLEPYYETHRIWHPNTMRGGILEQELLGFVGGMSRGSSDDVADAMSDHVDFGKTIRTTDYDPVSASRQMDGFNNKAWQPRDKDHWRRI